MLLRRCLGSYNYDFYWWIGVTSGLDCLADWELKLNLKILHFSAWKMFQKDGKWGCSNNRISHSESWRFPAILRLFFLAKYLKHITLCALCYAFFFAFLSKDLLQSVKQFDIYRASKYQAVSIPILSQFSRQLLNRCEIL